MDNETERGSEKDNEFVDFFLDTPNKGEKRDDSVDFDFLEHKQLSFDSDIYASPNYCPIELLSVKKDTINLLIQKNSYDTSLQNVLR
ncbi:hypothetical protein HK096_005581, partial [Nowakowskiella sp. JEL0078]